MKQKFATYPIGYFHIDIAEVQTEDGKLYMFVAVDRAFSHPLMFCGEVLQAYKLFVFLKQPRAAPRPPPISSCRNQHE